MQLIFMVYVMNINPYFIPECKNIAIALRQKGDYNPGNSVYTRDSDSKKCHLIQDVSGGCVLMLMVP